MGQRRPLFLDGGIIRALPAADTLPPSPIIAITGTAQTLGIAHLGAWLDCENASAQTLTIDTDANAAGPDNAEIQGMQMGAGKVSFVGAFGVTIRKRSVYNAACAGQYAPFGLKRVGANEWALFGELEPV